MSECASAHAAASRIGVSASMMPGQLMYEATETGKGSFQHSSTPSQKS